MSGSIRLMVIASVSLICFGVTAQAASYTVQNGLSGYGSQVNQTLSYGGWGYDDKGTGTAADDTISLGGYDSPGNDIWTGQDAIWFASSGFVHPDGNPHFHQRQLVRFGDLDAAITLGVNEVVSSAKLVLRNIGSQSAPSFAAPFAIEELLQPWTDGAVFWTNYGDGARDPGYTGAVMYSDVMDQTAISPLPATLEFDLDPTVVEGWITSPASNNGMVMAFSVGSNAAHFGGDGQGGLAPQLLIETIIIPEPASVAFLGLTGLALVLHRRRS